jgi:hypothetical protein
MTRSACLLTLLLASAVAPGCDSQTAASKPSPLTPTARSANHGTKLVKIRGGMKIKKGPDVPKAMPPIKFKSNN